MTTEITRFEFHPTDKYLSVIVSGRVDAIEPIVKWAREYRDAALKHGLNRILIDYRDMDFQLDYHDLILLADSADAVGYQGMGLRTAALISGEAWKSELDFDTVSSNRSIVFRSFLNRREALDWLLD